MCPVMEAAIVTVDALSEFERDTISERTKTGLESARARGREGGRPKGLLKETKNEEIHDKAIGMYINRYYFKHGKFGAATAA